MKTKLITLLAFITILSCSSPESIDKTGDINGIKLSAVSQLELASVDSWIQQNGTPTFKNTDGTIVDFNFNSLMKSNAKISDVNSLFATQVGYNRLNKQSVTISFYESNNKVKSVMFVRLTDNFNGTKTAEYFDVDSRLLTSALISAVEKNVIFTKNTKLAVNGRAMCGQAVADCMDDAYTRAGWGSVLLTLTSIIEPWTVVGVVAGCALQNCQ